MSRPSWRLGTLILAVFLLGAAAGYGVAVSRFIRGHEPRLWPRRVHAHMIDRLDRTLELNPEQRERIRVILTRREEELRARRRDVRREMRESREATRRDIELLLDPRQRERYGAMVETMRTRPGPHDTLESGR